MPRFAHGRRRNGQAVLETTIVMLLLCVLFFLVFDYARLLNCRTVLDYAAMRCARARAVGFNDFMVLKTARLGTISISGKCLTNFDDEPGGAEPSASMLQNRMGSYLQTANYAETEGILDFELWHKLNWACDESSDSVEMRVSQKQPLFKILSDGGEEDDDSASGYITLRGKAKIESHYPFYLK